MAILKVVWAGIKKRKVYSISIFLLVFMIAILLNIGVSMMQRASQIYDETHAKTNAIHIQYYFDPLYGEKVSGFEKWFEEDTRIKEVKVKHTIILEDGDYHFKDKGKLDPKIHVYPDTEKYMNKDNEVIDLDLKYDEIALPLYYQNTYHLKEGDSFDIFMGDTVMSFSIDSFFVDPIYGSDMISLKSAVLSCDRLNDIIKKIDIESLTLKDKYFIGVVAKDQFSQNIKEINEDFYENNDVPMNDSYSIELIKTGTLFGTNLILAIMIAFSILLFLIIVLVIRSAINSAVETDFTNIGILKALGFSSSQILMTIILQFSTLSFIGTILGVGISVFIIPYIGNVALTPTGLIWFGFPSVLMMMIILVILLAVINSLVYITSRKVMKITPVEAISGGEGDIYFNAYVNIPLRKLSILPLNLRMGLKQLLTKMNQYMMLMIITMILTLVTGMTLMMVSSFSDLRTTYRIFGYENTNVEIKADNEEVIENIIKEVSDKYTVHYSNLKTYHNLSIGSESILTTISKDFEKSDLKPIKGRFPKYDNEVSLTKTLADYLHKKIGDTLIISDVSGEEKLKFIITGYHQNINNMGKNMYLPFSGLKRIDETAQISNGELLIDQSLDLDRIVKELEEKYESDGSGIDIYRSDYASNAIVSIKNILSAVALGIFILVSLITSIITMLLAFIVIHKENNELGVYKTLGYGTLQMRLQFAARFGLVTCIGALIGSVLYSIFGANLIQLMLKSIGIGEINIGFNWINAVLPIGILAMVAFSVSFLASRRIEKVSPRILISE